jgi:hypothetical protein
MQVRQMLDMQQLVIPAQAGIQGFGNPLKILDTVFTGMTKYCRFRVVTSPSNKACRTTFFRGKHLILQIASLTAFGRPLPVELGEKSPSGQGV